MGGELNEAISLPQLPPFESSSVWSGSHHPSEGEIGVGGGGDRSLHGEVGWGCPLPSEGKIGVWGVGDGSLHGEVGWGCPLPSEGEIGVGGGGDGAGPCPLPPSLKRATLPNSPEAVVPSYQSHLKTILLLPSVPVLEG